MQQYKYVAVNLEKKKIQGTFIANDEKDLAAQLAKQSLYLVSCKPYNGGTVEPLFSNPVKLEELTTFCRQFAIMQNTHIPILDCLDILKNQPYTSYFKKILQIVHEDVKSGVVLSEALNKHPQVFPDFFRSMVYVGEMSGKMEIVFSSLADYYESDTAIKKKAKSAMSYPLMLMYMTVGVVILMLVFVVPTFRDALSALDVEITGLTKAVYDISDFILAYWVIILAAVIFIAIGIMFALQTEKGKYVRDVLMLKLPLVKTIQLNMITSRFARGFGLLLSSGMDLNEALAAIEIVLGNRYMKERFHEAAENVRQGTSMTVAFEAYKLFPAMMLQMISIGERTASLDDVLNRSCSFFDTQVESSLTSLTNKIQPVMLLIMGVVIATLFIAVYSPMLSIMNGLA